MYVCMYAHIHMNNYVHSAQNEKENGQSKERMKHHTL